jgi:uncharacterized protein
MYLVFDVDTQTLLEVDEITFDLLEEYQDKTKDELIQKWQNKYELSDLIEAYKEIDQIKTDGYLFSEHKYDDTKYKGNTVVKAMCLHIAHDCNMKCDYCFASQGNFQDETLLMSEKTGKEAVDYLIKHSQNRKHLEIDFFGGEPLMNFDVVKKVLEYALEQGGKHDKIFKFTITTNGILLSDDKIDYINKHMQNVVLSLDGRREINDRIRKTVNNQGTYDIIMPKFKKTVEKRGNNEYYLRGTYTKYNLDFYEDVKHVASEGFKSISFEPVVSAPTDAYAITEEDIEEIKKSYNKLAIDYLNQEQEGLDYEFFHFSLDLEQGPCAYKRISGCGAGNDYIAVTPKGEIFPCHQFVGQDEFLIGYLDGRKVNPNIREEFRKANLTHKDDCKECWAKYLCGGGCHASAYNFNKTLLKPHRVSCEIEKHRLENALMIYANKMNNK